jgi:predicted DNA-binding transcriptional regulator YafY
MASDRLFQIVYALLAKGTVTASELAAQLEVSTRTIYRDIEALSEAGIPVYATQGKGGGISILENYVLQKSLVTETEQQQILFAIKGLASTSIIDTEKLLTKLGALFKQRDMDWIEIDYTRWGNGQHDRRKLEQLKTGILERRCLTFSYFNSEGIGSERKVKPTKLLYKAKAWYLQAFCLEKQDYRMFKVNRIRNLALSQERFDELPQSVIAPQTDSPKELVELVLRFSPSAAYRVYDEFDDSLIERQPDGSFIVTVEFPFDNWVCGWLLSFGTSVEGLEPMPLRGLIVDKARDIIDMYGKN